MSSSGFKFQVLRAPRKNADGASAKKKSALKKRKDPPARRVTATKAKRNYLEMKKRHKKGLINKLKH